VRWTCWCVGGVSHEDSIVWVAMEMSRRPIVSVPPVWICFFLACEAWHNTKIDCTVDLEKGILQKMVIALISPWQNCRWLDNECFSYQKLYTQIYKWRIRAMYSVLFSTNVDGVAVWLVWLEMLTKAAREDSRTGCFNINLLPGVWILSDRRWDHSP